MGLFGKKKEVMRCPNCNSKKVAFDYQCKPGHRVLKCKKCGFTQER